MNSGDSEPLRCATHVLKGIHVLRVSGEVDVSGKDQFGRALESAVDGAHSPLVIDLTHVRYMDSSGFNALARAKRRMTERNDEIYIVLHDPHLQRLFSLIGFDKLFRVHETLNEAVSAAADSPRKTLR